jgi:hypothetical protein
VLRRISADVEIVDVDFFRCSLVSKIWMSMLLTIVVVAAVGICGSDPAVDALKPPHYARSQRERRTVFPIRCSRVVSRRSAQFGTHSGRGNEAGGRSFPTCRRIP